MKVKRFRKLVSVLVTLSMLLVLLVPLAAPAGAYSVNRADKIVSIADDHDGPTGVTFELKEDSKWEEDFVDGDVFQLLLPDGVNWNYSEITPTVVGKAKALKISDQILELTFDGVTDKVDSVVVPMNIEVDGAIGDLTIEVDPLDSGVSAGTYVFARVSGDNTTARALSVKTIGDRDVGGDIRIEEAAVGSLGYDSQYIKLKLPSRFKWDSNKYTDLKELVTFSGGLSDIKTVNAGLSDGQFNIKYEDSTMYINFNPVGEIGNDGKLVVESDARTTRGIITIKTPIKADRDARYGEIEVSISGDVTDDHDVVVADYADYGVDVTIDSVKDIKAGKFNQELKTITIEENVSGTLIPNRDVTLVFPEWVKITKASVKTTNVTVPKPDVDGTDNELDFYITEATKGTSKAKIKIDLEISVEGNRSGDIEMTVEGRKAGMADDVNLVVGEAVALVTAEADANKDVKIGVQAQEIGDITISELVKEAISDKANGEIDGNVVLTLPEGVSFSAKPKVEVTEGNLDIKSDNVGLSKDDSVLTIPIKSDSSKASTITVSNVKLTVDRTVPTGDLILKVGGGAIIENQKANKEGWLDGRGVSGSSDTVDEGEFDTGTAVKVKIANIVTPAPGEVSGTSVFTIGSTTYTVNGVEKSMDVAPYIKGDRTYIPVRFVAQSAGVADNNIIWNEADQSVILIKGDRVVKMIIGSNQLMINGIAVSMDTAPEIVDPGRTMLPLRAVTQALGCVVDWDPATQAASVTL